MYFSHLPGGRGKSLRSTGLFENSFFSSPIYILKRTKVKPAGNYAVAPNQLRLFLKN
jgi:hypothetical protein